MLHPKRVTVTVLPSEVPVSVLPSCLLASALPSRVIDTVLQGRAMAMVIPANTVLNRGTALEGQDMAMDLVHLAMAAMVLPEGRTMPLLAMVLPGGNATQLPGGRTMPLQAMAVLKHLATVAMVPSQDMVPEDGE